MNVALPAFVIFLVLLPGFIVRARFKRAERTSLDYSPFGQVVIEAVLWSTALHACWLWIAEQITGYSLKPDALMRLLSADPAGQSAAAIEVAKSWHLVLQYFGSLFIVAFVVPVAIRQAITSFRLDRTRHPLSKLCRFNRAPWYYLLTGADFGADEVPDMIVVSAVVDVAGQGCLYKGILDDFYLDENGVLERMVLQEVSRRPFAADKSGTDDEERFYSIEGDYFVLRYEEAVTRNIEYIKLVKPTEPDEVLEASTSEEQHANKDETPVSVRDTPAHLT